MYASFKRIEPGTYIGVDLGEEWEIVERLRCSDLSAGRAVWKLGLRVIIDI